MLHEKKYIIIETRRFNGHGKTNLNAQRSLDNQKEDRLQPTRRKSIISQKICRDVTVMKFPQILLGIP